VTGYVQLPRGQVTLVNCGIDDRVSVFWGEVLDCRDLGGENCRMTVAVSTDDGESIRRFLGGSAPWATGTTPWRRGGPESGSARRSFEEPEIRFRGIIP
jgi:hypothetical protein